MRIFGFEITRSKKVEEDNLYTNRGGLLFPQFSNSSALSISSVFQAIEMCSDQLGLLDIRVKSNKKHIEHNLEDVFNNHPMGKFLLMKQLTKDMLLNGNGYMLIKRNTEGEVQELIYLNPNEVTITMDKHKRPWYYVSSLNRTFEYTDVIHIRKHTSDGYKGISILTYANRSINIANHTENTADKFYSNGTNLNGILSVQSTLSAKQREELHESWNQSYSQGGLAVISGNMDYKPIQQSARESQLLDTRAYSVIDISRYFGISPLLLHDYSNNVYGSIEEALQMFTQFCIAPITKIFENEFNSKLLLPSQRKLFTIELDEHSLLKVNQSKANEYYGGLVDKGIISANEAREFLNMERIEENGMDDFIRPYTKIEDNKLNNKHGEGDKK